MARGKEEGPIISFLMNLFASVAFAAPTAVLLWFGLNGRWAWDNHDEDGAQEMLYISTDGFWILLCALIFVGVCFPRLFPGLMGFCWRKIMRLGRWF